ncbi:hypothetical protein HHK36_017181 [Tetracentron sinense]|uniref:Signal peptide peptidase n=1 Tax=Tetracentron sinense TaxID=13715 RepID=A0A835DFF5_TETSI|nr:hypothetical protein HHK36_017181 [Tetracentron sinense]
MMTSERVASLALAGLTLAPLVVKVDPNLNVILTACLTVYVGCYRSVKPTPPSETMSNEHAMRFPLVGSAMLLSLFLLFKFVSKDLVNAVLTCYFFVLGIIALSYVLSLLASSLEFLLIEVIGTNTALVSVFSPLTAVQHCYLQSVAFFQNGGMRTLLSGIFHIFVLWRFSLLGLRSLQQFQEHFSVHGMLHRSIGWPTIYWDSHSAFRSLGIACIVDICLHLVFLDHKFNSDVFLGIEMLSLGSFKTGAILLAGLFIYDIFWVFFTPVMVSVAKSFDAPIKLLFPTADSARPFSMLGLGDIVIPGIFVALALRFDVSRGKENRYFRSAFFGYTFGVVLTIIVMNWFQAAQPALLYIVPAVIGSMAVHCIWNGEVKPLLEFDESKITTTQDGETIDSDVKTSKKVE